MLWPGWDRTLRLTGANTNYDISGVSEGGCVEHETRGIKDIGTVYMNMSVVFMHVLFHSILLFSYIQNCTPKEQVVR